MKSSSSPSSSNDSSYFSAFPSPSTREYIHGEDDMESSSSSSSAAASSSSSSSFQSSSLNRTYSTGQNTHNHNGFISFREEDIQMTSSASSCSCSSCQPSSSNPSPSTTHDVFISFRGEDTRRGFVSYLHEALRRNGIRTYKDDCDLERGNEISSTLLRAIEQSKVSIIVFSKNYASSRWTMDELVKIMNGQKTRRQLILPIFYEISPSELRKKRSYSTVFKKHKNLFSSNMNEITQRWTKAMTEAADLAGWESSNYRTESELVEVIANEVKRQLESMSHGSEGISWQNCSPDEPNSEGSSHDDDPNKPEDSSPRKCLSHGTLNLLAYLGDRTWDVLLRKEHERLILKTRRPHQPSNSNTPSSYVYRNRYLPKQEQIWWETQQEHVQQ